MSELIAVFTIALLATISPGPDFAVVSRNSLSLSRRAGVLTAIGIGLAVLVHVSYTLLGVGVLIRQSIWLFNAIKLTGAIYLIYLGIKMLRSKPEAEAPGVTISPLSDAAALRVGFLTNLLNPKTTIFIVSLFMQVVRQDTSLHAQVGYGVVIAMIHIAWFSTVALFFSTRRVRDRLLAIRHWIDRVFGGLLVGFGVMLAAARGHR